VNLSPEQLKASLEKRMGALYVFVGDEALLLDEARQAVLSQARKAQVGERLRFEADNRFDWQSLNHISANLSLFAERRLIDLRIPTGQPGKEGAEFLKSLAASQSLAASTSADIWVISLPKLDSAAQKTVWFTALREAATTVIFWPVLLRDLPHWIENRGRAAGLQLDPDAAKLIAERVEGNLLAAKQELDKLSLLNLPNPISAESLLATIMDQSRFNPFDLGDALLEGDRARAAHLLARLRDEGAEVILILWVLSRELRLLASLDDPAAVERLPVPKGRKPLYARAARRAPSAHWLKLLGRCAQIDRAIKGVAQGEPWQMLDRVALAACGRGQGQRAG
jgi:DNA polymerase-3 subunit delta